MIFSCPPLPSSRQFDIDAKWVGPSRVDLYRDFMGLPPKARIKKNMEARQGGSMPPESMAQLEEHAAEGRVEILDDTEVSKCRFLREEG